MLATAGGTEIRCAHCSDAHSADDMLVVVCKQSFQAWRSDDRNSSWQRDQTYRKRITGIPLPQLISTPPALERRVIIPVHTTARLQLAFKQAEGLLLSHLDLLLPHASSILDEALHADRMKAQSFGTIISASSEFQLSQQAILDVKGHAKQSLCLKRHGNVSRIWDMLSGGQLLGRLANHQKTVTSLCTANSAGPAATSAPRLLSGSLDGHVKVPASAPITHLLNAQPNSQRRD